MRTPLVLVLLVCVAVAACALSEPEPLGTTQQALVGGGGTGPTPPAPDSCADGGDFEYCGTFAPSGCSCEADCGYKGNCCRDAVGACSDDPEMGWFYLDGDTFSTYSPEVSSTIRMDPITPATARWVAPTTDALVGLTRAIYAGLQDEETKMTCRLLQGQASWNLVAQGQSHPSADDASAQCSARALRAKNIQHLGTTNAATQGSNRRIIKLIGPATPSTTALLSVATFSNTDGGEEAFCEVFEHADNHYLQAEARSDADASCSANLWDLGPVPNAAPAQIYGVITESTAEIEMAKEGDHACFLTKIYVRDASASDEATGCNIFSRNGTWRLKATAPDDSEAECRATCIHITGNPYPASPMAVTLAGDGSEFVLYPDGPYDRPMVFVEGIDATNGLSAVHYAKEMALQFRSLQRVGFDIWMLDFEDGGESLFFNAFTVIAAIQTAHAHGSWADANPGKRFPLLGVSMGGIVSRHALSLWEVFDEPPISGWLTIAGTHYGAQIPVSAQTVLQNLGSVRDQVSSLEAYRSLNSTASKQMLTERVAECDDELVWEGCSALGVPLPRSGTLEIRGPEVLRRIPGSWPYEYDVLGSCPVSSSDHETTYQAINSLGLRPYGETERNGWPKSVPLKVGFSNGSWFAQSCNRLSNGVTCDSSDLGPNGEIVSNQTVLGRVDFESPGMFTFCNHSSQMFLLDQTNDTWPGDLSGRSLSNLNIVALKNGAEFGFTQLHPFLHHRTDRDLACPLASPGSDPASNDLACRATNRAENRFDYVHSNFDVNDDGQIYNGSHDTVSLPLGMVMLAYLYDGRPGGDADGWFTECADPQAPDATCNPFFRLCDDPQGTDASNPFCHESVNGTAQDCDETVHMMNNQCAPAGSCVGRCGGPSQGCSCDAFCTENGDCCPDYAAACGDGGDFASCAGSCGVASLTLNGNTCSCASNDNCCPDKITLCGACNDGVTNGSETDVDCGGPECAPCANQDACAVSSDCASGRCNAGVCAPWSRRLGGPHFDAYYMAVDTAFDPSGNLAVTGILQGPAEVGDTAPAPGVAHFDLFVGKYGPDGTHLWSKLVGSAANDAGMGVATDFDGNVIVGGKIGLWCNLGGDDLPGNEQALVVKYSPSGEHLWSKVFGEPYTDDTTLAIETLRTGEIVIAGAFGGSIDFGLGPLSAQGSLDMFVAKLDANGSPVWAKGFGGSAHDVVTDLAVNAAGEVVVTGNLLGPVDFGGGLLSPVGQDMFVLKLSSSGEHQWSAAFGGSASSITSSHAVAMSNDGAVFLTGSFAGTLSFGGPTFTSLSDDVFLTKLDEGGTLAWSQAFVGSGFDVAYSMTLDVYGDILVTGGFNSNFVNLGGPPLHQTPTHSPSFPFGMDVFLAKYDPVSGAHLYSTSYPSWGDDRAYVVATHPLTDETVLAGIFTDTLDMGGGMMTSAGYFDVFLTSVGIVP
jgi:hypothetical protein